jgi:hypothetical protein
LNLSDIFIEFYPLQSYLHLFHNPKFISRALCSSLLNSSCRAYGFSVKDVKKVYSHFGVQNTLFDLSPRYNIRFVQSSREVGLREELYPKQAELVHGKTFQDPQKLATEKQLKPLEGKLPNPSDTNAPHRMDTERKTPTSDLRPDLVTLQKVYNETPQITRAMEETAKTVREPVSVTRRVVPSP